MVWDPDEQDRLEELEEFHYDVPAHLQRELWNWVRDAIQPQRGNAQGQTTMDRLLTALRVDMVATFNTRQVNYPTILQWFERVCAKPTELLSVVRAVLKTLPNDDRAVLLEQMLVRGHSGYSVRIDKRGLEFRVPPAAREQVEQVVADSEEAVSQRLIQAWNGAYGIDPSPEHAYDMAIKAVEGAYWPIISPDGKSQLGTLIAAFNDAPNKWEFCLEDARPKGKPGRLTVDQVSVVLQMLQMLSYGQRARHPIEGAVGNSTQQARAAVQLAITLVQWVNTGAFRRR